jgi:hypothetical protein
MRRCIGAFSFETVRKSGSGGINESEKAEEGARILVKGAGGKFMRVPTVS